MVGLQTWKRIIACTIENKHMTYKICVSMTHGNTYIKKCVLGTMHISL
jgi:hypothetical protein